MSSYPAVDGWRLEAEVAIWIALRMAGLFGHLQSPEARGRIGVRQKEQGRREINFRSWMSTRIRTIFRNIKPSPSGNLQQQQETTVLVFGRFQAPSASCAVPPLQPNVS